MSDFIDDTEPAAPPSPPDPFSTPEPNTSAVDSGPDSASEAEPEKPAINLFDDPTESTRPTVNLWDAPATTPEPEPLSPDQFKAADAAELSASPTEPVSPSPYMRESAPPPGETDPNRPLVDRYRSAPPIERAVRPIEPIDSGVALSSWQDTASPVGAVPPPERTHYYPASATTFAEPPRQKRWPLALLAFASGLIGALLVGGGLFISGAFDDPVPATTIATPVATAPAQTVIVREVVPDGNGTAVASAVGRKVVPSIVTVEVGAGSATTDFTPFGSGSGVVFSDDGLILTNHHVIDGATTSRVIFQDGRIYGAEIIGSDPLTDVAVLRIDATDLTAIEFGSTTGLEIGDRAIAVGNPLGLDGGASLTVGVVSAFDREVNTGDDSPLFGMLQTDAPITNGSSGGALVNGAGELIGITTAIGVSDSGAEGIGFAIPVEVVRRIANQIIETGEVAHAFLGVSLQTNFEIQSDGAAFPAGAVVAGFAEGVSAAAEAGLELEDVILSWNGNEIGTINDLISGIRSANVGEVITLVVDRGGETLTFDVVLGVRPEGV